MAAARKCPVCKGRIIKKDVEKFLRGNGNIAVMEVRAEVCTSCGVRLYAPKVMLKFADAKKKLREGKTNDFILIGNSYKIA